MGVIAVFVALLALGAALVYLYRSRRHPESRMRAVIDAGVKAVPGVIAVVVGAVGIMVGMAYFVVLFFYWLVSYVIQAIIVSFTHGQIAFGTELGQLATTGVLYIGVGLLIALAGGGWIGLVVTLSVRRRLRLLRGTIHTAAPPARTVSGILPPPPPPKAAGGKRRSKPLG
jgi:hypothetical protein